MGFFYYTESSAETFARVAARAHRVVWREVRKMAAVGVLAVCFMAAVHGFLIYS